MGLALCCWLQKLLAADERMSDCVEMTQCPLVYVQHYCRALFFKVTERRATSSGLAWPGIAHIRLSLSPKTFSKNEPFSRDTRHLLFHAFEAGKVECSGTSINLYSSPPCCIFPALIKKRNLSGAMVKKTNFCSTLTSRPSLTLTHTHPPIKTPDHHWLVSSSKTWRK